MSGRGSGRTEGPRSEGLLPDTPAKSATTRGIPARTRHVQFIGGFVAAVIAIHSMGAFAYFTWLFFLIGAVIGVTLFLVRRPLGLGFLAGTACYFLFLYWLFSQMAWPPGF